MMSDPGYEEPGYPWDHQCETEYITEYKYSYPSVVFAVVDDYGDVKKVFYNKEVADEFAMCFDDVYVQTVEAGEDFDREKYKPVNIPDFRCECVFNRQDGNVIRVEDTHCGVKEYNTIRFTESKAIIGYNFNNTRNYVVPCALYQEAQYKMDEGWFPLIDTPCVGIKVANKIFGFVRPIYDIETGEILLREEEGIIESCRDKAKVRYINK